MQNPPDPRPVFEYDQVLTYRDLMGIREGYLYQYGMTPWYNIRRRSMFRIGVSVINEQLHWLAHGKPQNGVQCRGGH